MPVAVYAWGEATTLALLFHQLQRRIGNEA